MTPQEQNEIYEMLVRRANRPGTFTAVNGLRVASIGDGCAEGEADLTDSHLNPLGIPHGGVYCTMMDQVAGAAACSRGSMCRTVDCEVRFFAPARGGKLYSHAQTSPHGPQHHRHAGLGHRRRGHDLRRGDVHLPHEAGLPRGIKSKKKEAGIIKNNRTCLADLRAYFHERPLPLPLGEVAERSEDGEGETRGCKALSVTCGDSSPRGRAKGLYPYWHEKWSVSVPIRSIHCFTGKGGFFLPFIPLPASWTG